MLTGRMQEGLSQDKVNVVGKDLRFFSWSTSDFSSHNYITLFLQLLPLYLTGICSAGRNDASPTAVNKITTHTGSFTPLIHHLLQHRPATTQQGCTLKGRLEESERNSTDWLLINKYFVSANGNLPFLNECWHQYQPSRPDRGHEVTYSQGRWGIHNNWQVNNSLEVLLSSSAWGITAGLPPNPK